VSEPLLELQDVAKEFPVTAGVLQRRVAEVHAVSGVSLQIPEGSTFGLVGESGCGKTTLGRLVVGLERPTRGTILFDGKDVTADRRAAKATQRDRQMMFQDPYSSLDPRMKVGGIVREPLAIQGVGTRKEQAETVRRLLGEVGLPAAAAERLPHEFSGGQRQRIGLARALALNPRLIVADEPVSALDVSVRSQVLNLMRELQQLHRLAFVVISHDLTVVRYVSDRIGVMYLGKLVELGHPDRVYERPAHPYTAALIATIPLPDPRRERQKRGAAIRGELPSATRPPSGCRFRTRCPRAQELCAEVQPLLRSFGDGQLAACHFPLQTPESESAPEGVAN
jgi:peptide/nickel transport system ATP-binding protein